jgi:hypothetical protein
MSVIASVPLFGGRGVLFLTGNNLRQRCLGFIGLLPFPEKAVLKSFEPGIPGGIPAFNVRLY